MTLRQRSEIVILLTDIAKSTETVHRTVEIVDKRVCRLERALSKTVLGLTEIFDEVDKEAIMLKEDPKKRRDPTRHMLAPLVGELEESNKSDMDAGSDAPLVGEPEKSNKSDMDEGSDAPLVGEPAIPVGHTTGAAKILLWPAVADLIGENGIGGIDPLGREQQRGVLRLYGRGEGVGYSPASDISWGLVGEASPISELDEAAIRRLSSSYMTSLNVMHPIITQKHLDAMIASFLQQICETDKG